MPRARSQRGVNREAIPQQSRSNRTHHFPFRVIYFHTVDLRSAIKCSTIPIDHFRPFISDKTIALVVPSLPGTPVEPFRYCLLFQTFKQPTPSTTPKGLRGPFSIQTTTHQAAGRRRQTSRECKFTTREHQLITFPRASLLPLVLHQDNDRGRRKKNSEDNSAAFTFKMSQSRARAIRGNQQKRRRRR